MKLRDQFIISNISSCLQIFLLIPVLGCGSPSAWYQNTPPSPGTFNGTWILEDSTTTVMDCTTIVTKADSILQATVTNNTTKEILFVYGMEAKGDYVNPNGSGPIPVPTFYIVSDSSNFWGRIDSLEGPDARNFQFSSDADTLTYTALRAHRLLTIVCARK